MNCATKRKVGTPGVSKQEPQATLIVRNGEHARAELTKEILGHLGHRSCSRAINDVLKALSNLV